MLKLNQGNDIICFRDIKVEQLPLILQWYNKVDDFKYATGIDSPITLEELTGRYAEVAISSMEFFAGVYLFSCSKKSIKMIGIIKGCIGYQNMQTVWISSIVIDPVYQRKGFGTETIKLLLKYFKENCKVSDVFLAVLEENHKGRGFWGSMDFVSVRKIEKHLKFKDQLQNVYIMHKLL